MSPRHTPEEAEIAAVTHVLRSIARDEWGPNQTPRPGCHCLNCGLLVLGAGAHQLPPCSPPAAAGAA